jgi:hypothetical protein
VSDLVQLVGFICLTTAAFLFSVPVGLVAAGLSLLIIGHGLDGLTLSLRRTVDEPVVDDGDES